MHLINKLIIKTLKDMGVPVAFQKYTGKAPTYITFHEYIQTGEAFEDDEERYTSHYIQVDVWSKSDYSSIVAVIKQRLKAVGFHRQDEIDLYEVNTGIYHKGLRFYYLEEQEVK